MTNETPLHEEIALHLCNWYKFPATDIADLKGWAPGLLRHADELINLVRAYDHHHDALAYVTAVRAALIPGLGLPAEKVLEPRSHNGLTGHRWDIDFLCAVRRTPTKGGSAREGEWVRAITWSAVDGWALRRLIADPDGPTGPVRRSREDLRPEPDRVVVDVLAWINRATSWPVDDTQAGLHFTPSAATQEGVAREPER